MDTPKIPRVPKNFLSWFHNVLRSWSNNLGNSPWHHMGEKLRHERWELGSNTWAVSNNMWAMMPNLVNGHGFRVHILKLVLSFFIYFILKYLHFDWTKVKGAYYHGILRKTNQSIVHFYYNNPHQYMSLILILKHAFEHNTWNINHTLQHLQVQVATWPHCRSTLGRWWTCHYRNPPCKEI